MADFSTYQAGKAAQPGLMQLLFGGGRRQEAMEDAATKSLANIDYLRAHADQARAATELTRAKTAAETEANAPLDDNKLARLASLAVGVNQPTASAYLQRQSGAIPEDEALPSQNPAANVPIDPNVANKIAKAAFSILGTGRLGNYQQVTAGQGNTQEQDLTQEAVAAGDRGDRNALVTRVEALSRKPQLYAHSPEGVLNTASGKVDESGGLVQAKINALDALAGERDARGQTTKTGGAAATARLQVLRHFVDDLGMDEEEAIGKVRSLFGAKEHVSVDEIANKRYSEVLKATGSTKQAEKAEADMRKALAPKETPQQVTDREAQARGTFNKVEKQGGQSAAPMSEKDAKAVDSLKTIRTDRPRLKAAVQSLKQQGYTNDQIKLMLQKAGVPE